MVEIVYENPDSLFLQFPRGNWQEQVNSGWADLTVHLYVNTPS